VHGAEPSMKSFSSRVFLRWAIWFELSIVAFAQTGNIDPSSQSSGQQRTVTTERNFVKHIAFDQLHIWESPFKLRDSDATWVVPFGITAGTLIDTDRDVSRQLAKPSRQDISKKISNAGLFGMIGVGAGFYALGAATHDDRKRETGLLSGEAFINAMVVSEVLKYSFGRERPFEGDHFGHIGRGGSSLPSGHAIGTWAIASVVAHEYPNPIVQIGAYGIASAVAATRVTAGQHFPSDVLIGSTFGYLIGRKIYHDRRNPELAGADYGTFVQERKRDPAHSGSAYVPLESWVYPAIDRLAAMGLVNSNFDSERPWTRLECERLVREAAQNVEDVDSNTETRQLVGALAEEFQPESNVWEGNSKNRSVDLESVYTRVTEISGPVLRDGYDFAQTLFDDYGRPYGRGFNAITGFSARATSGPLILYFRGEYQHAPGNPNYSPTVKNLISSTLYGTPILDDQFPRASRFEVLDAYLGVNFTNNLLTLGPQSLWWGPGTGGPFMFSNNAEPLNMIRLSSVSPVDIPLLSRFLGPLRYDMFLGETDGYHYLLTSRGLLGPHLGTQPFVQGQRFTFKPTTNFEFGLTHTAVFGGTGFPLTIDSLYRATFSTALTVAGAANKPADRRSGFDIAYRVPKLRDWLTWYAEAFSEDEVSPIFFPRTSSMRSGIYAPRLPGLHRVDLRVEGVYTDIPNFGFTPGYFYANQTYRGGFTKNGNIMGNWIGREGRGTLSTSKIWLSAKNSVELGFRDATVDREFLQGGSYRDANIKVNLALKHDISISSMLQFERWRFPLLASTPQTNVTSSVQLTYWPTHSR